MNSIDELDLYPFYYKSVERIKWDCDQKDFIFQIYNENLSLDICRICTKYHPYLDENEYKKKVWEKHEKKKLSFLHKKLKDDKIVGISAYYKQEISEYLCNFCRRIKMIE